MPDPICKHCGKTEDEHHEFRALTMPAGCVCDPGTWDAEKITPICTAYVGTGSSYCATCEHESGCHHE